MVKWVGQEVPAIPIPAELPAEVPEAAEAIVLPPPKPAPKKEKSKAPLIIGGLVVVGIAILAFR